MNDDLNPDLKNRLDKLVREVEYFNRLTKYSMFKSFMLGLFGALGATVGVTILFAIFGFIVQVFGGYPVIGRVLEIIGRFFHK